MQEPPLGEIRRDLIRNRIALPQGQHMDQPTKAKDSWSLAIWALSRESEGAQLYYGTPDDKVDPTKEV